MALLFPFNDPQTPQHGAALDFRFTSAGVAQTIGAKGIGAGAVGAPRVAPTIVRPAGIAPPAPPAPRVRPRADVQQTLAPAGIAPSPFGSPVLGNGLVFRFTQPYTPPFSYQLPFSFDRHGGLPVRTVVPLAFVAVRFGTNAIKPSPYVYAVGFDAFAPGTARITNKSDLTQTAAAPSIAPPPMAGQVYAGTALNFRFRNPVYSGPTGNAIAFDFVLQESTDRGIYVVLGLLGAFGTSSVANKNATVLMPGVDSLVFGATLVYGGIAVRPPGIAPAVVPKPTIYNSTRQLLAEGIDAVSWPKPTVQNTAVVLLLGGIPPPSQTAPLHRDRQLPTPGIDYRVRRVVVDPSAQTSPIPITTTHYVAQYVQFIDQAGRGTVSHTFGASVVTLGVRTIDVPFTVTLVFGEVAVRRVHKVEPVGFDSAFFSDNAELLINTRKVYQTSSESDQAGYGTLRTWNYNTLVSVKGWVSDEFSFPVVFNRVQHVTAEPFNENTPPDQWSNFHPTVVNVLRELRTFGHGSSRFPFTHWVHNAAAPVFAGDIDFTLWGTTRVEHRIRFVELQGFDSFYNTRYTGVYNAARVVGPAGAGAQGVFGKPDPVLNLNRTVKHHTPWAGPMFGAAFIAYGVRRVYPNLFYDVPSGFPEVRFNPYPIRPKGIPKLGQVGGHFVEERFTIVYPKSTNVHANQWVGEPFVVNRSRTFQHFGYDTFEAGRLTIQNYIRYIVPGGVPPGLFGQALIARRTRTLVPVGVGVLPFSVLHRIRNDTPDPPSQQRINLDRYDEDGAPLDGDGIVPYTTGTPVVRLATIYPGSIDESACGKPTVATNALRVLSIFEDRLLGTPTILATQYIRPKNWPISTAVGIPRMSPWNIYAPAGDQMPLHYTPENNNTHEIGVRSNYSPDGSAFPWFGHVEVANRNRTIGPVPIENGLGFELYPKYGTHQVELRQRTIIVPAIKSLRMGTFGFFGLVQTIDMNDVEDAGFSDGIASSTAWGDNKVQFPGVATDGKHRPYPVGTDTSTVSSQAVVELFNRQVFPVGIDHGGNPQLNPGAPFVTPWGNALVGYPRVYDLGGYVMTVWGETDIDFFNREIFPVGTILGSLENPGLDSFRAPMRVTRRNPLHLVPSIPSSAAFGEVRVEYGLRSVRTTGFIGTAFGVTNLTKRSRIDVPGWFSGVFGDIDRWEAGKVKAHGDELSVFGTPRIRNPLRPIGTDSAVVPLPRVANGVRLYGIPPIGFAGPAVSNPDGCTVRVVSPLPILSAENVPQPEFA